MALTLFAAANSWKRRRNRFPAALQLSLTHAQSEFSTYPRTLLLNKKLKLDNEYVKSILCLSNGV